MAMPTTLPAPGEWTADEVWELLPDDGKRYEVIDGVLLVTPAPRLPHQFVLSALFAELQPFVSKHRVGTLMWSPADIRYGPKTMVQPDLFVAPLVNGRRPAEWSEITRLILAVEALSPSTARRDRGIKRELYQRQQTDDYWIVDLKGRLFERWRAGDDRPEILDTTLEWQPAGAPEPLTLDLTSLFDEIAPR